MSAFREAPLPDGRPGPLSLRRILAACFSAGGLALFAMAFRYAAAGWIVFLPGGVCILAALLLLFFTTWADVAAIIAAAKGKP